MEHHGLQTKHFENINKKRKSIIFLKHAQLLFSKCLCIEQLYSLCVLNKEETEKNMISCKLLNFCQWVCEDDHSTDDDDGHERDSSDKNSKNRSSRTHRHSQSKDNSKTHRDQSHKDSSNRDHNHDHDDSNQRDSKSSRH